MTTLASLQQFEAALNLPANSEINARLHKKQFYEHGDLTTSDKQAFSADIAAIEISHSFKPANSNIPPLVTDEIDYSELTLLRVTLHSPKRLARLAEVIQRTIPYPLLILFHQPEPTPHIAINCAHKRINRSDSSKVVIEQSICSDWLPLPPETAWQNQFIAAFSFANFSYHNFWQLTDSIMNHLIAYHAARHTGTYQPSHANPQQCWQAVNQLDKLAKQQMTLRKKLKQERQMSRQIALNSELRRIGLEIEQINRQI